MKKYVYSFGGGSADGDGKMKDVLGGKGAGLAEMSRAKLPVPPGFTIGTEVCNLYFQSGNKVPAEVDQQMNEALASLESKMGQKLGDTENPLLVSVRSGAKFSMPGMMDTILNLGLNDRTVEALERKGGNPRFAQDCYRRFIQMFGNVVLDVQKHDFDQIFEGRKKKARAKFDTDLTAEDLKAVIVDYKKLVEKKSGHPFPQDARQQLTMARDAVFRSWNGKRAIEYRRIEGIPDNLGTAVNVQTMVFGNLGETSATGVGFTRNPSTGERRFYGEFLVNAQGEDVVAGIRTPLDIDEMADRLPGAYKELLDTQDRLERHYHDMQDLEFTVERGKLYLLQTRGGKRTAAAAVRIARDMVSEGLIDKIEAVRRVPAADLDQLLHPIIDPSIRATPLCLGLPASPGAASGRAVFDPDTAQQRATAGENVILVRDERTPEDFHGIVAARAVLTARGGMTSHAAVVARGMGKCAIVGAKDIHVDLEHKSFSVNGTQVMEGDWLTLDGATGRVFSGDLATIPSEVVG